MAKFINIYMPQSELRRFQRWIKRIDIETQQRLKVLVHKAGQMMQRYAMMKAPVDNGFLRRSLNVKYRPDNLGLVFGAKVHYAPYQEWGTGKLVSVPAHLRDYAMQFKGKGIRQVNIRPKPYFFDSYERVYKAFIKDIRKLGFHERPV
jgi:hypothetical protein